MTDRKLYLTFSDAGVTGILTPCWDTAPQTCAAIRGALERPMRVTASHAIFPGPEIMAGLPETHRTFDPAALPPENQTVLPQPGDML